MIASYLAKPDPASIAPYINFFVISLIIRFRIIKRSFAMSLISLLFKFCFG